MAQLGIQFILRKENLLNDYHTIADICNLKRVNEDDIPRAMEKVGRIDTIKSDFNPKLANKIIKMLSLDNHTKKLDPAWYALDINTYNMIINYLKQDFTCFKFEYNYKNDVLNRIKLN